MIIKVEASPAGFEAISEEATSRRGLRFSRCDALHVPCFATAMAGLPPATGSAIELGSMVNWTMDGMDIQEPLWKCYAVMNRLFLDIKPEGK